MSSLSDKRRSSLAQFWLALAASLVVLTGATLALPHDPYIRYQSLQDTIYAKTTWIYERIHHDPDPIDVVFIGSSRTNRGVNVLMLEDALAARGVDANIVNFSLPSSGLDVRDTILRETFAHKVPKLVVLSVVETFPRDGHDVFGELSSVRSILSAPVIVNRKLPGALLRLPVRQLNLAAATRLPNAWGYRARFDPSAYAGDDVYTRADDDAALLASAGHLESLTKQAERRKNSITPPILPQSLSWIEFGVSQRYVDDIVALAEENGAAVAFLFLPFFNGYDAPTEANWLTARGPLWNAAFLKDNPQNYIDSGHVANTPRMRDMIAGWLADHVAKILEGKS